MSEPSGTIASSSMEAVEDTSQPKKKLKTESSSNLIDTVLPAKLEERLGSILCCTVCLDLSDNFIYQCVNGHLMCHRCLEHLLADARLKDESSTCPNCRVEISRNQVSRNLAVEKAIAELPATCAYCRNKFQRNTIRNHEKVLCDERTSCCQYQILGCSWKGPFIEQSEHEKICSQPSCDGRKILPYLRRMFDAHDEEMSSHMDILSFLSIERMYFTDIQLKPFRTDEFHHRLMYDTSSFSAFGYNWCVKLHINDHDKDAHLSTERLMSYQLVLKTKPTTALSLKFFMVKGPYHHSLVEIEPQISCQEFNEKQMESTFYKLSLVGNSACNHLLSLRVIDLRIFLTLSTR